MLNCLPKEVWDTDKYGLKFLQRGFEQSKLLSRLYDKYVQYSLPRGRKGRLLHAGFITPMANIILGSEDIHAINGENQLLQREG
jgi:hypothetical protein